MKFPITVIIGAFISGSSITAAESPAPVTLAATGVLAKLANGLVSLEFDLGKHYPESEVNDVLHGFHTDVATLRRYLVDEGHLDRGDGRYWRSGGRTDTR